MPDPISRRDFLKQGSYTAAALPFIGSPQSATAIEPLAKLALRNTYSVPTLCPYCPARCQLLVKIHKGKAIKIEGNPKSSLNGEKICAVGASSIKLLSDPDRLKYPLKRTGPRGSGSFKRIGWAEAIDTIAAQLSDTLKNYGPEALGLFIKGPSSGYIKELFSELGVGNIADVSLESCRINRDLAYQLTFGTPAQDPSLIDLTSTRCLVLFGSHLGENSSSPQLIGAILDGLGRGMKLVVVDPRFSTMAAKATHHLMIRPGTDTALVLGWLNHIISNGLYDQEFVRNNVHGFDQLQETAGQYTVDKVAGYTDLPASVIRETAEIISASGPATILFPGNNSSWYGNDVQRLRSQAILTGILGSWGAPGGLQPARQNESRAKEQFAIHKVTSGFDLIRKMEASQLQIVGCWGQNILRSQPNTYRTISALRKVPFIFACDVMPVETTLYADIVLPESMFLERSDILETYDLASATAVGMRFPMVAAQFEAQDPYSIVKQLSSRLGRGKGFSYENVLQRLNYELQAYGLTAQSLFNQGGVATVENRQQSAHRQEPEPLPPDPFMDPFMASGQTAPRSMLPTPSTRIEAFSDMLQQSDHPPLPIFEPPQLPPAGFSRLLYGRSPTRGDSSTTNNPWLIHEQRENTLWINDTVADLLQLTTDDAVFLENQDGLRSITAVKVFVTPGIRSDCVYLVHGFGSRSPHMRLAFNRGVADEPLLSRTFADPISGSRSRRTNFIRLIKNGKILAFPDSDRPPEGFIYAHTRTAPIP